MRNFFFPLKDASIYSELPSRTTGLDEILEVGKTDDGLNSIRSLIDFDFSAISSSIANGAIPSNAKYDIRLFVANATKIARNQVIQVFPLSQSWCEGSGYFYQNIVGETDGVSWKFRSSGSTWAISGATYYPSPSASGSTAVPLTDLTIDVTNLVQQFISGAYSDGFLIKYPNTDESSSANQGDLSFFSKDTHTIYLPVLIAKWDDSSYVTGSYPVAPADTLMVHPRNLAPSYKVGEQTRIDLNVRQQYPVKTFATQFTAYSGNMYLPSSSYYSVVDIQSQEVIVPFDQYSIISTDANGSYFNLRTEKMFPRRFYKVMIKVVISEYEYIFDNNYQFTITV